MTNQELLLELAEITDAGEHTKFQLLQNWQEYSLARKTRRTIYVLIKSLRTTADRQLKAYCKDVVLGTTDVYKLLAYGYVKKILNFYLEELRITEDIIDEYETYLLVGNWLDFVLGLQRPADKQFDHRGI